MRTLGLVVPLLVLTACPKKDEPPAPPEPPVASPRFAEPVIPFDVAGDLNVLGQLELVAANFARGKDFGPLSGASLFFVDREDDPTMVRKVSLHAVVALRDRVVVVYFGAPDGALTVAHGGLDAPWQKQVLDTQVTRPWVGALDAVALKDGRVAIFVRQRLRPSKFYVWSTDGRLVEEAVDFPVDATWAHHWTYTRCQDAWLDVAPDGTLAAVWGMGLRVGFKTRAPDGTWSDNDPPPVVDFNSVMAPHYDVGCVNRVVFDGSGFPQVLTLLRRYDQVPRARAEPYSPAVVGPPPPGYTDPNFLPLGLLGNSGTELTTFGYARRVGGWYRVSPSETLPSQEFNLEHGYHSGYLALDLHPSGFVVSGPSLQPGKPHFTFKVSSFTHRALGLQGGKLPLFIPVAEWQNTLFDLSWREREVPGGGVERYQDPSSARTNAVATYFSFSECGGALLWGPDSFRDPRMKGIFEVGRRDCATERRAPLNRQVSQKEFPGFPVFAHGPRPYQVGVCLDEASAKLELCYGGYPRWPFTVDEGPALASASPPAGSVLPVTMERVSLTLERALLDDETAKLAVANVNYGDETITDLSGPGPTFTATVPGSLEPGQVLRVALLINSPRGEATWVTRPPPVVLYTLGGPTKVDPRVVPTEPPCRGARTATACEVTDPSGRLAGEGFELHLDYDYDTADLGLPFLFNADGGRNRDVTVTRSRNVLTRDSRFDFIWSSDQPPNERVTVQFPQDLVDSHGVTLKEEWRRWVVTTGP